MPEETLTLWVYERQEPLLRSTKEMEPRYSRLQTVLKRLTIRSICALPLTTARRKLGAITFGSKQLDTYSPREVGFVSQVAGYIALAFDDASNFAALRRASEELQSNNDRLQLLLDVTKSGCLQFGAPRSAPCHLAGRPTRDAVRLRRLIAPGGGRQAATLRG